MVKLYHHVNYIVIRSYNKPYGNFFFLNNLVGDYNKINTCTPNADKQILIAI